MRIAIFMIMFLTISMVSFSQRQLIGIKIGPGFTNIAGDFFEDADLRIGVNTGVTYEYFLTDNFSLGTGLTYSQRGFKNYFYLRSADNEPMGTKTTEWNYDYIAIPLKVSYSGSTKFYGFFSVGLIPALIVSAKTKIPPIDPLKGETIDAKKNVTPIDLAGMLEVGGGYKISERFQVFLGLSGQYSFTPFTNDDYFEDAKAHHYGIALSAGVKYAISGK